MEPIVINNNCKTSDYPTKVSIIDSKGDLNAPEAIHILIEYNHVSEGQEQNLVTFSFWTKNDSTILKGLEKLDLYNAGVPTEIYEDDENNPDDSVISAIKTYCGVDVDKYVCDFTDSYIHIYDEKDKEELKKRIESKVIKFVEGYADAMFHSGCTVKEMKHSYNVAFSNLDIDCMVEMWLDQHFTHMFYDMEEEWELDHYLSVVIHQHGDEYFLSLKEDDERVEARKKGNKTIDYEGLREVLMYEVENVLNEEENPKPSDVPVVRDLYRRTLKVFKYIFEEITSDPELLKLFKEKKADEIVERLIVLISKHEDTDIPAPYDDIDDWWGDYNGTINYLVWSYKEDMESERRWGRI